MNRYFVSDDQRILFRIPPNPADIGHRFVAGRWIEDPEAYSKATGLRGDYFADEIPEQEARETFPLAFGS